MADEPMGSGAALHEMARRVVVDYLGVTKGEAFLLITDQETPPALAEALLAAANERASTPCTLGCGRAGRAGRSRRT